MQQMASPSFSLYTITPYTSLTNKHAEVNQDAKRRSQTNNDLPPHPQLEQHVTVDPKTRYYSLLPALAQAGNDGKSNLAS
jgi:hypothetical protein